jgi:ribosome maturation factor RimP
LVETKVNQIIEGAVNELGFSVVRVRFSGGKAGRNQLQIMAEPREDREMTVEDCQMLSRHISTLLDIDDPIASAYLLEVSSPGIDRPLTRIEDFDRFNGELAKIILRLMLDGRRRFQGRLTGLSADSKVGIETSFGRFEFAFDEIESARIDPSEILARRGTIG